MWEFEFDYGELNFWVQWTVTEEERDFKSITLNGQNIDFDSEILDLIINHNCEIMVIHGTGKHFLVCNPYTLRDYLLDQIYEEDTPY